MKMHFLFCFLSFIDRKRISLKKDKKIEKKSGKTRKRKPKKKLTDIINLLNYNNWKISIKYKISIKNSMYINMEIMEVN